MKLELNKVYEDGEGVQWVVLAYCPILYDPPYVAHSRCKKNIRSFSEDGLFYLYSYDDSRNLVKLIGDKFTDET
jgi:hypothetical protein